MHNCKVFQVVGHPGVDEVACSQFAQKMVAEEEEEEEREEKEEVMCFH